MIAKFLQWAEKNGYYLMRQDQFGNMYYPGPAAVLAVAATWVAEELENDDLA